MTIGRFLTKAVQNFFKLNLLITKVAEWSTHEKEFVKRAVSVQIVDLVVNIKKQNTIDLKIFTINRKEFIREKDYIKKLQMGF